MSFILVIALLVPNRDEKLLLLINNHNIIITIC